MYTYIHINRVAAPGDRRPAHLLGGDAGDSENTTVRRRE